MLRMILGAGRRRTVAQADAHGDGESSSSTSDVLPAAIDSSSSVIQETWVDWIKRVTGFMREQLRKHGIEDWCVTWRRKQWRCAHRVPNLSWDLWALKAVFWKTEFDVRSESDYKESRRKTGQMISLHIFVHVVYQLQKTHGQRGRWTLHFGSTTRTNFPDVVRRTQSTEG